MTSEPKQTQETNMKPKDQEALDSFINEITHALRSESSLVELHENLPLSTEDRAFLLRALSIVKNRLLILEMYINRAEEAIEKARDAEYTRQPIVDEELIEKV